MNAVDLEVDSTASSFAVADDGLVVVADDDGLVAVAGRSCEMQSLSPA